jgi:hypothetical protein
MCPIFAIAIAVATDGAALAEMAELIQFCSEAINPAANVCSTASKISSFLDKFTSVPINLSATATLDYDYGSAAEPEPVPAVGPYPALTIQLPCQQPTSIEILPSSLTLNSGQSEAATALLSDAADRLVHSSAYTVNWSTIDPNVASSQPTESLVNVTGVNPGIAQLTATTFAATELTKTIPVTVNNPTPTITSLSPGSLPPGSSSALLIINGTRFLSAPSTVTFNGIPHAARYLSATQLTIQLSASDLANAGTFPVIVTNPPPGGGASNTVFFSVGPTSCTITGQVGAPLSVSLVNDPACNTTGATSCSFVKGSIPFAPGVTTLGGSCTISGTPTQAGSFSGDVFQFNTGQQFQLLLNIGPPPANK